MKMTHFRLRIGVTKGDCGMNERTRLPAQRSVNDLAGMATEISVAWLFAKIFEVG